MVETKKTPLNPDESEIPQQTGLLVVISGLSGAGKDTIAESIIANNNEIIINRLVTHTDRPQRPDEIKGYHYHFVAPEELDELHYQGHLVEDPVTYGTSRKATTKSAFDPVLEGQNLLWRIDPSRAVEVARGDFFDRVFEPNQSEILKRRCIVIFITADQNSLQNRRKSRDKDKYAPTDYKMRDIQDQQLLNEFKHEFQHIITNSDDKLEQTLKQVFTIIKNAL